MIKSKNMDVISFKNLFKSILMTLVFWTISSSIDHVSATHIIGGNLVYRHIKGDTFEIKLVLRRDCYLGSPEAEFDDPARIYVFDDQGQPAKFLSGLNSDPNKFYDGYMKLPFMVSDTLNEFIRSDCGFEGTQVCVHQTTYLGRIVLSRAKKFYTFAYQRCCRNATLANITDPLNTGATYWTTITQDAFRLNNSSPIFKEWPDVYICANKDLVFDHSATDVNGDSLVYRLCTPNLGANKNDSDPDPISFPPYTDPADFVDWIGPYSLNDMLGGTPLRIDPKTGVLTANPNLVGQFLVGICVEEYRNGVRIGIVRRDFQFNVRICSQPPLAQFTTSESNCDGLRVEFYNNSLSANSYQWNFDYPNTNPAFTSTDKDPVFTFPKSGVYDVRLMVTRGSDLCFDTIVKKVSVFENTILPDFKYTLSDCNADKDSLTIALNDNSVFNEPGYALNQWNWTITQNGVISTFTGKNVQVPLSTTGDVTVKLELLADNGCKSEFSKTISIDDIIPKLDFDFALVGCPSSGLAEITLTDLSGPLNPFASIINTAWNIGTQTFTGSPVNLSLPQDTEKFDVNLVTTFDGGCSASLTKTFDLSNFVPQSDFLIAPVSCPDDENITIRIQYVDTLSNGIAANDISWLAGTFTNQNVYNGASVEVTIPKDSILFIEMQTTFANGCIDIIKTEHLAGPFATLKFVAGPIIVCPNDEKQIITNGNPAWTYTWSPTDGLDLTDPANPKVITDVNQTYNVTVTDGLCTVTGSVDVIALAAGINLSVLADTVTCDGNITLTASGGVGQGVYSWGTDPTIDPVIATGQSVDLSFTGKEETYYVTFVGEACATEPAVITVKNELPRIDDLSPFRICRSDTTKIITLNLVNYHQNTYTWESNPHLIAGGNTSDPTIGVGPDETGSFVLFYNVENQFGCKLRDSVTFNIENNPVTDFSFTLTECGEYKVCFKNLNTFEGFNVWNFGDLTTTDDKSLDTIPCYVYPDAGTYTITLSNITNVCPFKDVQKTITINPQIQIAENPDLLLCKGDTVKLKVNSNVQNAQYEWFDANGKSIASGPDYSAVVDTNTLFIVKGVDNFGCDDTDTIQVNVFAFDFDVVTKDSFCVNEPSSVNLNIVNPDDYNITWSPSQYIQSGANTTNPVILPIDGIRLQLVLQHKASGCTDTIDISPKVTLPFSFDVTTPEIFCLDVSTSIALNITNPNDYTYLWTPAECIVSGDKTASPILNIVEDKTIHVVVTKISSGCKQELDVDVKAGEEVNINVDAKPDFEIYEGDTLEIYIDNIINGATYVWSTGETDTSIMVNPTETTSYQVTVTDENGCTATDEVTVTVRLAQCDETDVYLPTAFTPNGDKVNNTFVPRSHFIDEVHFIIYNRWGQEVFSTKRIDHGWDGTFEGKDLPPDAYAYYLRVRCVNAEEFVKRGNVTLIR